MADDYDVVILDCPPGISLVSENVVHATGTLLVPLIPTTLSVRTLDQLTGFVAELDQPPALFPFFTMVDGRKRLHREVIDDLRARRDDLAATVIPALSLVEQMSVHRAPCRRSPPAAGSPAATRTCGPRSATAPVRTARGAGPTARPRGAQPSRS